MRVELEPGSYVVAVSGGVDSVALLDVLRNLPGVKLTVAHYDHGIRSDSHLDRELVQAMAKQYRLPFVFHEGRLGNGASEALARSKRYEFLEQVKRAVRADAIITAHHQDDVIETAVINLLRGTGRKGITALKSHRHLVRPLLAVPKDDIRAYARDQGLLWREDSTNQDETLLRNYVRRVILPKLGPAGRQTLLNHINHLSVVNRAIDNDLMIYLHLQPARQTLDRAHFAQLPHSVAREVLAQWLRSHQINFDSKSIEAIVIKSKTLAPGKRIDLDAHHRLLIGNDSIVLVGNS